MFPSVLYHAKEALWFPEMLGPLGPSACPPTLFPNVQMAHIHRPREDKTAGMHFSPRPRQVSRHASSSPASQMCKHFCSNEI